MHFKHILSLCPYTFLHDYIKKYELASSYVHIILTLKAWRKLSNQVYKCMENHIQYVYIFKFFRMLHSEIMHSYVIFLLLWQRLYIKLCFCVNELSNIWKIIDFNQSLYHWTLSCWYGNIWANYRIKTQKFMNYIWKYFKKYF